MTKKRLGDEDTRERFLFFAKSKADVVLTVWINGGYVDVIIHLRAVAFDRILYFLLASTGLAPPSPAPHELLIGIRSVFIKENAPDCTDINAIDIVPNCYGPKSIDGFHTSCAQNGGSLPNMCHFGVTLHQNRI